MPQPRKGCKACMNSARSARAGLRWALEPVRCAVILVLLSVAAGPDAAAQVRIGADGSLMPDFVPEAPSDPSGPSAGRGGPRSSPTIGGDRTEGGTGILPRFVPGDRTGPADRGGASEERDGADGRLDRVRKPYRPYRRRLHVPPHVGLRYIIVERQDRIALPPAPTPAPPDPATPDPAPPEAAQTPAPPDPGSPRTAVLARGTQPRGQPPEVGEFIPERRPVVLLDWRTYALPEPEPGTQYVRYGRSVVLIDPASREVLAVLDPAP